MSVRWVTLTPFELEIAAHVGHRRHIEAMAAGRPDRHGFRDVSGEGWNCHIEGAGGEMSVAKALNCYWNGSVNTFRNKADVGEVEVKTRSSHQYDLLVRPDDDDNKVFFLVTGKAPRYCVRGWLRAVQAKSPEYVQAYGGRPPAWFVPSRFLNSVEEYMSHAMQESNNRSRDRVR